MKICAQLSKDVWISSVGQILKYSITRIVLMQYLPLSQDLSPFNFFSFPNVKICLKDNIRECREYLKKCNDTGSQVEFQRCFD